MDEQTKVCPECGAEFFAYVNECNRCEAELVPTEEVRRHLPPVKESPLVCIEEGSYEQADEIAWALRSEGFDVRVLRAPAGSCKGGFGAFVEEAVARDAVRKMEEILKKRHPEVDEAEERLRKGLCPACGAALMGSSDECPDCGLNLGGGGGDCSGDGGCGSCH